MFAGVNQILDDRPYVGYTYLGLAVHRTPPKIMDTIELDMGIVGPHSYAEVDKRYFVADIGAGIGVSAKWFKVTYGVIYRTKEFKTQSPNGHLFGTLLITFFL